MLNEPYFVSIFALVLFGALAVSVILALATPKWLFFYCTFILFLFGSSVVAIPLESWQLRNPEAPSLFLASPLEILGGSAFLAGIYRAWRGRGRPSLPAVLLIGLLLTAPLLTFATQGRFAGTATFLALSGYLLLGSTTGGRLSPSDFVPSARLTILVSTLLLAYQLFRGRMFVRIANPYVGESWLDLRGLNPSAAMVVGVVVISYTLGFRAFRRSSLDVIGLLMLVICLATVQQRTVWIATGAGIAVALVAVRRRRATWKSDSSSLISSPKGLVFLILIPSLGTLALGSLLNPNQDTPPTLSGKHGEASDTWVRTMLAAPVYSALPTTDATFTFSHRDGNLPLMSFTDMSNARFRVNQHLSFLEDLKSDPKILIIGQAAGNYDPKSWSPHSAYVLLLRHYGTLGLILFLLVLLSPFKHKPFGQTRRQLFPALAATTLIFSVSYPTAPILALLSGTVVWTAASKHSELGTRLRRSAHRPQKVSATPNTDLAKPT